MSYCLDLYKKPIARLPSNLNDGVNQLPTQQILKIFFNRKTQRTEKQAKMEQD